MSPGESELQSLRRREATLAAELFAARVDQQAMLALTLDVRRLDDPEEIMATTAAAIGSHLRADRTGFFIMIDDATSDHIACWSAGVLPLVSGPQAVDFLGEPVIRQNHLGHTTVVSDTLRDPLTIGAGWDRIGIRAAIGKPVVRHGRWAAGCHVDQIAPRAWTPGEVGFVEAAAELAWDMVQHARSRIAMRKTEARWRSIFERMQEAFVVGEIVYAPDGTAIDHRYIDVNAAVKGLTGYAPAEVIGHLATELIPTTAAFWTKVYARVVETGEPNVSEHRSSYGGLWFEVNAFRIEPTRFAALLLNITDRKRAEAELHTLNETLERRVEARTRERDSAWTNSLDLQTVIDPEGIIQAANDAWTTVVGWLPDEVVGRSHLAFAHPDQQERNLRAVARAASTPQPAFECLWRHRDGSYRSIAWVAASAGGLVYASGRDITAEKAAAAELATTQDQLRQAQKMEAVGQLTGGLAHDFNNLLTGITGSLELLNTRVQQGRLSEVGRHIAAAQAAAARAAALTHRLLAFARRQNLEPEPTRANQLVSGMMELIRRTVGPQIRLEEKLAPDLWLTLSDPNQLENALLNLCINARDAMPDGGSLTIRTANVALARPGAAAADDGASPAGDFVEIGVTDSGTGMSPETASRAFDPFFTTKPVGLGTGLGLSMIYGFARQSGGTAQIVSAIGEGTTVRVLLPRHRSKADAAPAAAPGGAAILVVDDEPTVRMLVSEVVTDLGYEAIEAPDGRAGLAVLQSGVRIDLLVTALGLPGGMTGRQMADAARQARPRLNVLFITGYPEDTIGSDRAEPGIHVMAKPFAMDALASRIKAIAGLATS